MEHAPLHPSGPGLQRTRSTSSGFGRLRVVPWQGDPYVALLGPKPSGRGPSTGDVLRCLATLRQVGVSRAVTPALYAEDTRPFIQAGFQLHERLHLLAYPLLGPPKGPSDGWPKPGSDVKLRPGRPWHREAVVDVDQASFEPFWQFDRDALNEARRATPTHRFRVAVQNGKVVGYAVTGRAGHRGYLQRLAVSPAAEGSGIGSALVHDCLRWLHRRGAKTAMVNTQERNARAYRLYRHLGFTPQAEGLVVLSWDRPG